MYKYGITIFCNCDGRNCEMENPNPTEFRGMHFKSEAQLEAEKKGWTFRSSHCYCPSCSKKREAAGY